MQWRVLTTFFVFAYACLQEKLALSEYIWPEVVYAYNILSCVFILLIALVLKRALFSRPQGLAGMKSFSPLLVANFLSFLIGLMALPVVSTFLESLTTTLQNQFDESGMGNFESLKLLLTGILVFALACGVEFIRAICITRISQQMKVSGHFQDVVISKKQYCHSPAIFGLYLSDLFLLF